MEKLPKVFVNPINHDVDNYQKIYVSSSKLDRNYHSEEKNIVKTIDNILGSSRHIYRTKVRIVLNDNKEREILIISRTKDYIITIDNERINIDDIKDIKVI